MRFKVSAGSSWETINVECARTSVALIIYRKQKCGVFDVRKTN